MRNIKVFTDIADLNSIADMCKNPIVEGVTTNPTLMRKAGITNYEKFARDAMSQLKELLPNGCLSLEVFADDFYNMREQALKINEWAEAEKYNVYVKIPVHNTTGDNLSELMNSLNSSGVQLNVTAVFTPGQVISVLETLHDDVENILSVFCGRISDAGQDAEETMSAYLEYRNQLNPSVKMLWASTREVYNYVQADSIGVDIITMTPDLIKKIPGIGKHLRLVSLETIQMFRDDAVASGFNIE